MRRLALLFTLIPALGWAAPAPAEDLLAEGRAAVTAENYQRALELYRRAVAAAPDDPAPHRALGELFTAQGLHDLALPEWRRLVDLEPGDPLAWQSLAQTWSYLDRNAESVRILEEAATRFPADAAVAQALAWMLFKTEDFGRGIAVIEAFEKEHGEERGLEMTLGTLYSSVYDYGASRLHYLRSLDLARGTDDYSRNFRSVGWYNLSLLEKAFHQFDLADEAILRSLAEVDRPAGALARGELVQGRRDYAEARRLYEKAAASDTETPLGRFDLAQLLIQFGRLDEAEAHLVQVEHFPDRTWLFNYGVTQDKFRRDLAELRANLHQARYRALDFRPRVTPWDWALWLVDKLAEAWRAWTWEQTWKAQLVKLSETSLAVRNSPDAWINLTLANQDRPGLALKYLDLIRRHELPRNPRAGASYQVEEGLITRDAATLRRGLAGLTLPWENEDRERALQVLIDREREVGRDASARKLQTELFGLNPGALTNRGWGVPVRSAVFGDPALVGPWREQWKAYLGQSGWDAGAADRPGVSLSLDLQVGPEAVVWTLRDGEGATLKSGAVRIPAGQALPAAGQIYQAVHLVR